MSRQAAVLRLDLTQPLLREPPTDLVTALRSRKRPLFDAVLRAIRRVATDDGIAGIVARVGGPVPVIDLAHAQELRAALLEVRAAGKPLLGFAETFGEGGPGTVGYLAATAFTQLWLQSSGDLGLTGFGFTTVFAREALDRLGVQARIGQRHEYKNAPATLLATGYSEPHREALTAVADGLFTQVVDAIAADRGVAADAVRELTHRAPLTPEVALEAGLIDHIGYRDEFADAVETAFGTGVPRTDVTHVLARGGGLRHPAAALAPRSGARPALALVSVVGGIKTGRNGRSALTGSSVGSDDVCAALREAGRDPGIAGVVLRVDSPGGSALASDTIRREVLRLRRVGKPVVASMGSYAASGGYYVSMAADRIFAQPATLTGSIGVFGGKVVTRDLAERYGIRRDAVTAGGRPLLSSPAFDYDDDGWAQLNASLDRIYDDFTAKAAADRGLPLERLRELARGRVWLGADALERGLVDAIGDLEAARVAAAGLTGLDPDTTKLVRFPATDVVSRLKTAAGGAGPRQPVLGQVSAHLGELAGLASLAAVAGVPTLAAVVGDLLAGTDGGDLGVFGDALALLSAGPSGVLRMPERLLV